MCLEWVGTRTSAKAVLTALLLTLVGLVGCQKPCFLHECDYDHYRDAGLPRDLDTNLAASSLAPQVLLVPPPTTVRDTERPIRYLSLYEALAMGLERGNVGTPNVVAGAGFGNDTLVSYQNRTVIGSDSIRVLALDPAVAGADIEAALAKFDTRWSSKLSWATRDVPVASLIDQFQNADTATVQTGLLKPLPTGGVAGITFVTDYTLVTNPPANVALPGGANIIFLAVNPAYRPRLQFQFEQPLLQNFGVEINQLRATHPGSVLSPFTINNRPEGILITRLRFDQQRAELERNVNLLLLNVESAYWNLYGAYWTAYSREAAFRQAFEAWRLNQKRFDQGQAPLQDLAQSRQQYELFRGQRLLAVGDVLERERQLRGLLGLALEDGFRLVPSDVPTTAAYEPNWECALGEAITLRPELVLARQELKVRQLELINQKNLLRPDLRFLSTYDINGLGTQLDGPGPDNALRSFTSNKFHSWSLGLNLDMPLGFREAHANVRVARLNLARSYEVLKDQEDKVQRLLGLQYRRIIEYYDLIGAQRAQREAATIQLERRSQEFQTGQTTLDLLLESQRVWAEALRGEYDALVLYNNALAAYQFAKGTIQQHNNVQIAEGPLPGCAQERAVEYARQRDRALVLARRTEPARLPAAAEGLCPPQVPGELAAPLSAVLEGQPPLPMPANLPAPRRVPTESPYQGR